MTISKPRFSVSAGHEHKAFIPFSSVFASSPPPARHQVVRARAVCLQPHSLALDREWQGSHTIPFDFLVAATGTRLAAPATMPGDDKAPSVQHLQAYQRRIQAAQSVVIIGGGAVGVQMACDAKELYPSKSITLVHSRQQLMPVFHEALSNLIKERLSALGVDLVAGSRVVVPPGGFPITNDNQDDPFTVHLQDGRTLSADLVIQATGQTPNNHFIRAGLAPAPAPASSPPPEPETEADSIINPANGFVRVRPTMQFLDARFPPPLRRGRHSRLGRAEGRAAGHGAGGGRGAEYRALGGGGELRG